MIDRDHRWNVSFKPVVVGFLLSIILTLAAYYVVIYPPLNKGVLTGAVVGMGLLQVLFQFVFFLHLGLEAKPRWNLLIFLFMLLLVVVLVGGSLWIMHNLDYHMMPMRN